MDFPDHPFWDFSLDVYGRDGVAPACLALQERHGADVNVVMLCLWLGRAGHPPLEADTLADLTDRVADWHEEVVRGLRYIRRRLKEALGPVPDDLQKALRRRVKKIELEAEHIEQLVLAHGYNEDGSRQKPLAQRAATARDNLAAYLATLGIDPDADDAAHARAILAGVFPDLDPDEAGRLAKALAA